MSLNFFIFFASYFIILFSITGYGYFLLSFEKNNKNYLNFGYIGILGLFFLIIYSYLSNILIPHSKNHNIVVIIFGLISFLYFIIKYYKKKFFKKNFIFLLSVFFIIFFSLLIFKNHDDFLYYHFSYTYNLTQNDLDFGIGKFNHGFRTPSSIFYLNSLFYLPLVEYFSFNFSAAYILGFANIILLKKITNFFVNFELKNKKIDFINYLALLFFIFVNIFFYRLSEHGTDRSAQILILVLFIYLLNYFQNLKNDKIDLFFLYALFGIIISLKAFYFLYFIFFIPLFYFIYKKKKNFLNSINFFLKNRYFVYFLFLILFVIFSYFTNTGCLLYPVAFTCFDNLAWSISSDVASQMNDHYELWSKAGLTPISKVANPSEYIQGFNWVNNWINLYFFNKVSDFLLGLFFVILILKLCLMGNSKIKSFNYSNKCIIGTYLLLIILLFEWFYNHPALRYGGFSIFVLLIFIPFSIYFARYKINYKKFNKIAIILIITSVLILELRNTARIVKEINIYNYEPFKETFYTIKDDNFDLIRIIEKEKNRNGIFSKSVF